MVRWTEMRIKPTDTEENQLKKLVSGEDSPEYMPEFFYQYSPQVFEIEDVARFNRSQDKKSTTLRFKDGDSCVVDIPYEKWRKLYIQCTGKVIHSTIPDPSSNEAASAKPTKHDTISEADDFDIEIG